MKQSLFITFEGCDGSGKSTLMKKIKRELQTKGYDVVTTFEPGGTLLGQQIRSLLLSTSSEAKVGSIAELMLFLADRAQHIEEIIRPNLETGKIVLCDRYYDSTIVYQGYARGLNLKQVKKLCELVVGDMIPDITFYLDVDLNIALRRILSAREADRMETGKQLFLDKVRKGYRELAELDKERFHMLNANQKQKLVLQEALSIIEHVLG